FGVVDDVLPDIGQPQPPSTVHVFYGRSAHFVGPVDVAAADAHIELPTEPRAWMSRAAGIGDINGDGYGDMIVRVDGDADNDQPHPVDMRIIMGSRTRLPTNATAVSLASTQIVGEGLSTAIVGAYVSGTSSAVATPLGDLDGDGVGDFALFGSVPFGQ